MQPDCSLKAEEELTQDGETASSHPYKDFFTSSQRGRRRPIEVTFLG